MQDFEETRPMIYPGEVSEKTVLDRILEMAKILDEQNAPDDRYIAVHKSWLPLIHRIWGWRPWKKRRGIRGRKAALWRKPRLL